MTSPQLRDAAWSAPVVQDIAHLVAARTGLVFSRPRHQTIEAAIRREASRAGHPGLAAYHAALRADASAVDALAAELTIGETYFFRDTPQFDLLRSRILPELAASPPADGAVRVWSAGCASGEEPYSLAILCHELGLGARTKILGTDLSRDRLTAAREARYGRWSLRGVPDAVIAAYFTRRDTRYDLRPALRDMVEFRYLNLADVADTGPNSAPGRMDLILCRNVLIYFDAATTARVIRHLLSALSPRGWLLLGASDPPITDYADCDVVVTPAGLAYRPAGTTPPRSGVSHATRAYEVSVRTDDMPVAPVPATVTYSPPAAPFHNAPDPRREALARIVEAHSEGRESLAAELAREFIARGGTELTVWVIRVRALANAGSLSEAGKSCAAALELHPLSAELTYLQAILLINAGRYVEAADTCRRALYLDHTLAVAHVALGDALARLNHAADARRALRVALRLLAQMAPDAIVPASGGERSARMTAAITSRLALMESGT